MEKQALLFSLFPAHFAAAVAVRVIVVVDISAGEARRVVIVAMNLRRQAAKLVVLIIYHAPHIARVGLAVEYTTIVGIVGDNLIAHNTAVPPSLPDTAVVLVVFILISDKTA